MLGTVLQCLNPSLNTAMTARLLGGSKAYGVSRVTTATTERQECHLADCQRGLASFHIQILFTSASTTQELSVVN